MGTPHLEAIATIGGGVRTGRDIGVVLQGVSSAVITPDQLDTPLTWEAMASIGSGLGASAFIVFDDTADAAAIAAGVSRFLAVESCGQCTPCQQDGLAIADALERLCRADPEPDDLATIESRLTTVGDGARCSLALQHQAVVGSLLERFPDAFDSKTRRGTAPAVTVAPVIPMHDLDDGRPELDLEQAAKLPDWTFGAEWGGQSPADRLDDHRTHERL
jgi:NADH:ubiquinone oxidoreductase subunit F (NADH-binding)